MPVELAPEVETTLREYAAREGLTTSDYLARLLRTVTLSQTIGLAPRKAPRLHNVSHEQAIRLNAASVRRLDAELTDAEKALPQEIADAEAEWRSLAQSLNENRRDNGERLLFPVFPEAVPE